MPSAAVLPLTWTPRRSATLFTCGMNASSPGSSGPVYVMLLELDAPDPAAAEALQGDLDRLRTELGVEIGLEALEREAL